MGPPVAEPWARQPISNAGCVVAPCTAACRRQRHGRPPPSFPAIGAGVAALVLASLAQPWDVSGSRAARQDQAQFESKETARRRFRQLGAIGSGRNGDFFWPNCFCCQRHEACFNHERKRGRRDCLAARQRRWQRWGHALPPAVLVRVRDRRRKNVRRALLSLQRPTATTRRVLLPIPRSVRAQVFVVEHITQQASTNSARTHARTCTGITTTRSRASHNGGDRA